MAATALNAGAAHAASDGAYPISTFFEGTGSDIDRFQYRIREELLASKTFRPGSKEDDGFRLHISFIAQPDGTISYGLAFSLRLTLNNGMSPDMLLDNTVGYCGTSVIATCAQTVVARAASDAEAVKDFADSLKASKLK